MCGKKEKVGILGDKSAKKLPEGFADEKQSRKLLTFEIVSESSVNFVYMDQKHIRDWKTEIWFQEGVGTGKSFQRLKGCML